MFNANIQYMSSPCKSKFGLSWSHCNAISFHSGSLHWKHQLLVPIFVSCFLIFSRSFVNEGRGRSGRIQNIFKHQGKRALIHIYTMVSVLSVKQCGKLCHHSLRVTSAIARTTSSIGRVPGYNHSSNASISRQPWSWKPHLKLPDLLQRTQTGIYVLPTADTQLQPFFKCEQIIEADWETMKRSKNHLNSRPFTGFHLLSAWGYYQE